MKLPSLPKGRIGDLVIIVIAVLALLGSLLFWYAHQAVGPTVQNSDDVAAFVNSFGDKIAEMPPTGPEAEAKEAIQALYRSYVSEELLAAWVADPSKAPGRQTGPRLNGLRVSSVQNTAPGSYIVKTHLTRLTTIGTTTDTIDGPKVIFGVIRLGASWKIVEYVVDPT